MFAVPGWSVSASSLKTQTTSAKPTGGQDAPTQSSQPTKKRKRGHGKGDVTAKNLVDMWESVVEGKPKAEDNSVKKAKTEDVTEEQTAKRHGKEGKREKKERKERKDSKKGEKRQDAHPSHSPPPKSTPATETLSMSAPTAAPKLTPLQASMRAKLMGARFRHLNQTLYTTESGHALSLFQLSPEMFDEYHTGFRKQVEDWPENPVDRYLAQILVRGKQRPGGRGAAATPASAVLPLPRTHGVCRIADLGCGDAKLAQSLQSAQKKLHLEIHSFDLISKHPLVTRADIAHLPLADGSVDVAILCLALMGTNWVDFIDEAFRVLRWKGELWVAEIKSRFSRRGEDGVVAHSVGKRKKGAAKEQERAQQAEEQELQVEVDGQERESTTDVSRFVQVLQRHGFALPAADKPGAGPPIDLDNRMFVKMLFVKAASPVRGKHVSDVTRAAADTRAAGKPKKKFIERDDADADVDEAAVLKPCVYKLR